MISAWARAPAATSSATMALEMAKFVSRKVKNWVRFERPVKAAKRRTPSS